MVKNLFVVLPFCIKDYEEKAQQLAHEAELKLDTYCEVVVPNSFRTRNKEQDDIGYLSDCLEYIAFSDVIVFTHDWKDFMESRVLHDIAEYYNLNVLELKVDAIDILDTNDEEPQEEDLKLMQNMDGEEQ